jgi:hypothetical protein
LAQFEGILCNVDRLLQLYAMVKESSYSQRSVTSLDYETFFFWLSGTFIFCAIFNDKYSPLKLLTVGT